MSVAKKINLKDNEKIMSLVRPYILSYMWKYLVGLVFLFTSSFFMFRLFFYGWWGDVLYALGMLIGLYIIFRTWFFNYKNTLVLTSMRVVDLHRVGLFDEIMSSVSYLDIKDIVIRKKGIWQSLFNFGGLAISAKNEQLILEVLNIYNPSQVQSMLSDLEQQYKQDIKLASTGSIYNNFIKIIPNLSDGDLVEIKRLIDEQLGPNLAAQ
ncbi:MAG: hypothetical protein KBC69_01515 [Candidatus Magasanikbacteria bacterium]|nr:hypothetical protein [Candidatus Magasanikbacteria bacterium]